MGFDQMMLLYDQYTVMGAKMTITCVSSTLPLAAGIYLNPDAVAVTSPLQLVENGLVAATHLDCSYTGGGTGQRIAKVTKSVDIPSYFARPRGLSIVNDPELHGTASANPVEQVYFGVCAWDFITNESTTLYYDVLIEYDVVFSEPRKLAVS